MDLKVQNWKNFTDQHLYDWHGIWTRYTPTGEVLGSFRSLRRFEGNADKTEIYQLNKYIYAEDNVQEHSWNYNLSDHSLSDGIFHPQMEYVRGYFFPSGHAGWLIMSCSLDSKKGIELFFKYQHFRHSVIMVYDVSGNFFGISHIREDSTGYPSFFWSTELEQLSSRNLNKNWQGTSTTITPNLQISDSVTTQFSWDREDHKIFYLPDGVSISCPEKVTVGTSFCCMANWLINEQEMQQLIANYDASGKFESLTLECYELK